MTDKLFDDFVQSKLEQYDSGAPMHVWERMQKEKNDRKGFFFFRKKFLILGIALLAFTGIGFITSELFLKQKGSVAANPDFKINTREKEPVTEQHSYLNKPNFSSTRTENNTNSENNIIDPIIEKSSTPVSALVYKSNSTTAASKNSLLILQKQKVSFSKNSETKFFSRKQVLRSLKTISGANSLTTFSNASDAIHFQLNSFYKLNRTGYIPANNILTVFQPSPAINQPQVRPSCPTIRGPRRNDLYLEFYVSPDYTVRSFSKENTQANYIAKRKSTEDSRNGFSAGVRIAKNLGEKTFLKTGVNYSQINERLRIVSQNQKQITQIITIRTVIRAPGDTLFIRDTSYFEQTGTLYRTSYNRYRFIDIPVIFSYELGNPDLMSFTLNAGPVINVISFYKGEVLDTSYIPIKISTAKGTGPQHWRNNIGIGLFASISIQKKLNERMQVFGEPYLRYNFNSVTQNNTIIKQRYAITGMQLGIRYNLVKSRQRYPR